MLNRAKLARMTYQPEKAIEILKRGLDPERPIKFVQADSLLVFELAWILLADRKYEEAAETFLRMKELNTWSHGTYTFIAAGCYIALKTPESKAKAKNLLDTLPEQLERRKMGGKDLPTEVFIKKRVEFYKAKQVKRAGAGTEKDYVDSISICPAEEIGIFWNSYSRISKEIAEAHIHELLSISPPVTIPTPFSKVIEPSTSNTEPVIDTTDEHAIRNLLLGILHRSTGNYIECKAFLQAVISHEKEFESNWVSPIAHFELAVLCLKEASAEDVAIATESSSKSTPRDRWLACLKEATKHLDDATARSGANVDLSGRLDSRIALLRDEIQYKRDSLDTA